MAALAFTVMRSLHLPIAVSDASFVHSTMPNAHITNHTIMSHLTNPRRSSRPVLPRSDPRLHRLLNPIYIPTVNLFPRLLDLLQHSIIAHTRLRHDIRRLRIEGDVVCLDA